MYMIFALAKAPFVDSILPLVNVLLSIVSSFNIGLTETCEYIACLVMLFTVYAVFLVIKKFLETLILKTTRLRALCIEFEDSQLNKSLKREVAGLNKDINKSLVYVELSPKKAPGLNVVLEEQYQLLIKFLSSKLCVTPEKYKNGYLFIDVPIEKIDKYFECFFKALGSAAPVRYLFVVQAVEKNSYKEAYKELDFLINTALFDHVIVSPTTKLRYEHNEICGYNMTVVGNFIYEDESQNVYEVRDRFF